MKTNPNSIVRISLIVALGGLLMGFDASVISGVVSSIEAKFALTKLQLGWSVASLTLTSTLAMMVAGPLSDRYGRRTLLRIAAVLYAISAIFSAMAPNFVSLVVARMIGGLGVGTSLILAPMYIAEISPAKLRGRMVSFNQLNIVIGISLAFFSNYLILQLAKSDAAWVSNLGIDKGHWRWMLGVEMIPAILYFVGLFFVPRSPRWLVMKGNSQEAFGVVSRIIGEKEATQQLKIIEESLEVETRKSKSRIHDLFKPALKLVLLIGIVIAILQQITGINAVFFYAPTIFEQSGIGTDASFVQAILVGLVNLVFTIVAMLFIDRIGRKPLLVAGVLGIALSMFLLTYGFRSATYTLETDKLSSMEIGAELSERLQPITGKTFESDLDFQDAIRSALSTEEILKYKSSLISAAIDINPLLILIGILFFVASFAVSIGPVMWVLFSELFPNNIRGLAISFVGLINSATSFMVQWIFPWELDTLGNSTTFFIYGCFAAIGLVFVIRMIPETKGKSLEELEKQLVKH